MAAKKRFLLRCDEAVYAALERWAADELRSVNGQIEFVLRDALRRSGRLPGTTPEPQDDDGDE
jgi:hypothetical protein